MLFTHWVGWTHPSFFIIIIYKSLASISMLFLLRVPASSLLIGMTCLFPRDFSSYSFLFNVLDAPLLYYFYSSLDLF
jgi:hypothetical protein